MSNGFRRNMAENITSRTMFDSLFNSWSTLDGMTLEECQASCLHEETKTRCRAKLYVGKDHDKCEFYCMACGAECTPANARCASEIHFRLIIDGASEPEDIIVRGSPVRDAPLLAQAWAYRLVIAYQNLKAVAKRKNRAVPKELNTNRNIAAHAIVYDWRTSAFKKENGEILPVADLPRLIAWAERWQNL